MADTEPIALQAHFSPADREAWRVAARRALRGQPLEGLTQHMLEGIVRHPLYDTAPRDNTGDPGFLKVLRGTAALDRRMVGWDIRVHIACGTAAEAGQLAADETAGAARSVWISPATATKPGVALPDAAALAALLGQLDLATTPVAIDVGATPLPWLTALLAGTRAQGEDTAALTGALRTDVAGTLAQTGTLPRSADACFDALAEAYRVAGAEAPSLHLVAASALPVHDAGADAAWSLAFAVASGLDTLRALVARGIAPATAARRIELTLGSHADQFLTIASVRALRVLWAKALTLFDVRDHAAFVHVVTGRTTTARRAPWTNMLRGTNEAAGAAMGGADAITLTPYDSAVGEPDALARRIARNAQLILAREGHLARVADPAAGSGYVEALTDAVARQAWRHLQQLESVGGVIEALQRGVVQAAVAKTVAARRAALADGERVIVGVNAFQQANEPTLSRRQATTQPGNLGDQRAEVPPSRVQACAPLTPYTDEQAWHLTQTEGVAAVANTEEDRP